jgi:hypothetical protein
MKLSPKFSAAKIYRKKNPPKGGSDAAALDQ